MQDLTILLPRWRERHKLTQAEAAARLGVTIHSIRNWEQGRTRPEGLAMKFLLILISPKGK